MLDRRFFLGGSAAAALIGLSRSSAIGASIDVEPRLTPEMFGAKGDGVTDDSAAFSALSDRINAAGGGTVILRQTTYLVAKRGDDVQQWAKPARLLVFENCSRSLVIRGNNAKIRCAPGQRYGVFTASGDASAKTGKKRIGAKVASPYDQMIYVHSCSGDVEIADLELDGSVAALKIGGRVGDKGWQISATGIKLRNNTGAETLRNIHTHHHGHDGIYIDGVDADTKPRRQLIGIRSDNNGRQGMSIVGGRGYEFVDSSFTDTGRAGLKSAPAAGVDIEAERHKQIRRLRFENCRFENNSGAGMVADTGNSADVRFEGCTFVSTATWAIWADKPGFVFDQCLFAGSIVHPCSSADPAQATHFTNCTFRDDPKLSSTGAIKLRDNLIANIPHATNVLFDHCRFLLDHEGILPFTRHAIYQDCVMSQRSSKQSFTAGTFKGTNRITGNANIGDSAIQGVVILNGRTIGARS